MKACPADTVEELKKDHDGFATAAPAALCVRVRFRVHSVRVTHHVARPLLGRHHPLWSHKIKDKTAVFSSTIYVENLLTIHCAIRFYFSQMTGRLHSPEHFVCTVQGEAVKKILFALLASAAGAAALATADAAHASGDVVTIKKAVTPGTIIVRTQERRLYYVTGAGQAISYPVGVGNREQI